MHFVIKATFITSQAVTPPALLKESLCVSLCSKMGRRGADPYRRDIFFVSAIDGYAFCNRNNLGASREITVKAKISIEYPLSIVGTGVLDGPKTKRIYIFSVCCFVMDNRRMCIF